MGHVQFEKDLATSLSLKNLFELRPHRRIYKFSKQGVAVSRDYFFQPFGPERVGVGRGVVALKMAQLTFLVKYSNQRGGGATLPLDPYIRQ